MHASWLETHVPPKAESSHAEMVSDGAHVHCAVVGMTLGSDVGTDVGVLEGKPDGTAVGLDDGDEVGAGDGTGDGAAVGSRFVKTQSGRLTSSDARISDPFPDCPHTLQRRSDGVVPPEIER